MKKPSQPESLSGRTLEVRPTPSCRVCGWLLALATGALLWLLIAKGACAACAPSSADHDGTKINVRRG